MFYDRKMNSPGTQGSENVTLEIEMNCFRFSESESRHANTKESPMSWKHPTSNENGLFSGEKS
jgi:hypothetical protein